MIDIATKFFNKLSPTVRDLLITENLEVPQRIPTKTNYQGNQRLLQVRNAALEAEKKTTTIKSAVQTSGGSLHHMTLMSMP